MVPVLPFVFSQGMTAVWTALVVRALGVFFIGAAITLLTGRSLWTSGLRQLLFGLAAAGATFGIGHLIGANLGG